MNAETVFAANLNWRVCKSNSQAGDQRPTIVFFHGASFSIDDWIRIGTLKVVSDRGYNMVALDLPRGRASKTDSLELEKISDYNPLLEELLLKVGIPKDKRIVIIGPSMGGGFAMSFALDNPEKVAGLVLIAPSLRDFKEDTIRSLRREIPVLLVWGDMDDVFSLEVYARPLEKMLSNAKLLILKYARHPAYLDKTLEFHESLLEFLEHLAKK